MEGKADLISSLPNDIANGSLGSAAALLGNLAEAASFAALVSSHILHGDLALRLCCHTMHCTILSVGLGLQDSNLHAHGGQESLMEAAMSFTAAASQLLGRLPMQTLFPAKYDEEDDFQESPSAQLSSGSPRPRPSPAWSSLDVYK